MSPQLRVLAIVLSSHHSPPLTSGGRKTIISQVPSKPSVGAVTLPSPVRDETNCVAFCLQLRKLFQNLDRRRAACPNTATWGQKVSDSATHSKRQLVLLACLITPCAFSEGRLCMWRSTSTPRSPPCRIWGRDNTIMPDKMIFFRNTARYVLTSAFSSPHRNDYLCSSSNAYSR